MAKKLSKSHQVRRSDRGTGKRWSNSKAGVVDGKNFSSGTERGVYRNLKLLEAAGEIRDIRCQVKLHICGKLYWNIDFVVFNVKLGRDEAHEGKGRLFPRAQAQMQAWEGHGPMDLYVWTGPEHGVAITKIIRGKSGT